MLRLSMGAGGQGGEYAALSDLHSFSAMALDLPNVDGHPNRVPFSGVMTLVDEPSDNPPGGAKGKRVLIPKEVAEAALPSLLGMAVDFADDLSGHEPTQKVGLITGADIVGNEVRIEGFLYAADFPEVVAKLKKLKKKLGFSYECKANVEDWNADVLVISRCVFTGAAVLFKDAAAYTTTSFTASKEQPEMTREEIEALINAQTGPLNQQLEALRVENAELKAAAETHNRVKPHAEALRACADAMQADAIGMHPENGHVQLIRKVADHMEASAVLGRIPDAYNGGYVHASADLAASAERVTYLTDENATHVARIAELEGQLSASAGDLANVTAERDELKQAGFNASADPGRQTQTTLTAGRLDRENSTPKQRAEAAAEAFRQRMLAQSAP